MLIYIFVISVSAFAFSLIIMLLYGMTKNRQAVARRLSQITKRKKEHTAVASSEKRFALKNIFKFLDIKYMDSLANELSMAGIPLRVEEYLAIWFVLTIGIPAFSVFFGAKLLVTLGLSIIGCAAPIFIIKFKKSKRTSLFNKQLVDALTIMCNCLKTGFSFQTAMESVAKEMSYPISWEFDRMLRELKLGLSMEHSLEQMVKRTGNKDLELISNAVSIQKQVGGNLSEILDSISQTIKERIKISDEIKVLTATGRVSGYIIGLLPVFILILLMVINPSYVEEFFVTSNGRMMLGVCVVLEVIGFLFVKKIVTVKF